MYELFTEFTIDFFFHSGYFAEYIEVDNIYKFVEDVICCMM